MVIGYRKTQKLYAVVNVYFNEPFEKLSLVFWQRDVAILTDQTLI